MPFHFSPLTFHFSPRLCHSERSEESLSLNVRTHCEMFRFAQHDILSINNVIICVILSVAKNLSVKGEK